MTAYWSEHALLPAGLAREVRFEIAGGRFIAVTPNARPDGATPLPGVVLPGFANCHSHAFHRALRGRTQDRGGTFWTWRERMYALAAQLDPDRFLALARATYAEMARAGVTTVGEFHYLHHAPGGRPYADPNTMGEALRQAAVEAGIRLTLLDTCYLAGGLTAEGHTDLDDVQLRFADRDADAWAARADARSADDNTRLGVAAHSVRAVPRDALPTVAASGEGLPLHVHVSEQPAENAACRVVYGMSPTELLAEQHVLGPLTTAVHATHAGAADIDLLAATGSTVCFCPTTERDLADGIGPARALLAAGGRLSLGSDQHAVVDLFEEARGVEMHERLQSQQRGCLTPAALLELLTRHDTLGWPDAGELAPGNRADLVAVRLDSIRTAGCDPGQVVFAAGTVDIDMVLVDGRPVVEAGRHRLGDIGALLTAAIEAAWQD